MLKKPKTSNTTNADVVVVKTRRQWFKGFDFLDFITKPATFITISLVVVLAAGVGVYFVDKANDAKKAAQKTTKSHQQIVSEKITSERKENIAASLAKDASADEIKQYHTDKLWLLIKAGDNAKVSDYYIQTVAPQSIQLDLDLSEAVVRALIIEGHDPEAKTLVQSIIQTYKSNTPSGDPAVQQYIDQRIQTYTNLEEKL